MADAEKTEDEKFAEDVKDCAARYLFGPLNEARTKGVTPNIAVFALMECLHLIISSNVPDRAAAIEEFEALTGAYVKDWKQRD
jgi:hypothetical protein